MEIKCHSSKLVKPSTPTPSNLRNYGISFFDEQMPNLNTPLILYYSTFHKSQDDVHAKIFNHLETSLSITLSDFYPLAGRYMRHASFIDCSDQGALYVEAVANFRLSEFLDVAWELKFNMLHDFLPCEIGEAGEMDDPMLSIKVTIFECGGVAIGMCFSHKFSDMSTMCTFIDNWATRSQNIVNPLELGKHSPSFGLASRFPKREMVDHSPRLPRSSIEVKTPVRIFSFKGNAISKMRDELIFKDDRSHRPSKDVAYRMHIRTMQKTIYLTRGVMWPTHNHILVHKLMQLCAPDRLLENTPELSVAGCWWCMGPFCLISGAVRPYPLA